MHARVRGTPPALRSAFVVHRHHLSIESIPNCLVWHAHVLVPRLYSRAICGGVDIATMRDPAQSGSEAGGGGGGQEPQPRRVSCDVTWHPTRDTRWAMGASPPFPAHRNNTQLRIASGRIPMYIVRRVGENLGRRIREEHEHTTTQHAATRRARFAYLWLFQW